MPHVGFASLFRIVSVAIMQFDMMNSELKEINMTFFLIQYSTIPIHGQCFSFILWFRNRHKHLNIVPLCFVFDSN